MGLWLAVAGLSAVVCVAEEPNKDAASEKLPPREVTIKKATDKITVDGKLDEESWKNAEKLPIDMLHAKGQKIEPVGYARMTWDSTNVFIAFEVLDKTVQAEGDKRDNANIMPPNDVVEIFIDINNDPEHFFELHVNPLNAFNDLFIVRPRPESPLGKRMMFGLMFLNEYNLKDYETAVQVQGTLNKAGDADQGWTCEIRIPFESLLMPQGQKVPVPADVWRVQLVVQDGSSANRYVNWSPDYDVWYHHAIDNWGRVKFAP